MEISKGIEMIGKSLWIKKQKILIIADLHIGYEEALNKQGILIPRTQFNDMKIEISKLLNELKPKTVIINGDLKHEFGEISSQEWKEALQIIDLFKKNSDNLILIKGNHDNMLEPIVKKKGIILKEFYSIDKDTCVFHGHKIPLDAAVHKSKLFIVAHEHPSISLREGMKSEKYKCFLLGAWHKKKIIAMPSFFPYIEGIDIRNEERLCKLLHENIGNFRVFVMGDKIYDFGYIKDLKRL